MPLPTHTKSSVTCRIAAGELQGEWYVLAKSASVDSCLRRYRVRLLRRDCWMNLLVRDNSARVRPRMRPIHGDEALGLSHVAD